MGDELIDERPGVAAVRPDPMQPRVLLVEDDNDVRVVTRIALERAGWDVTEAKTAADARELARRTDPDVVLMDLGLPDADGTTLLGQLKCDDEVAWVPVVVLSGRSSGAEVSALLLAGAQDYLVKPVRPGELIARLTAARRVALEHRRASSEHARVVAAEEEFRLLAETSTDVVTRVAIDGTIVYVSPSIEVLAGWRPSEVIGTNALDWIHPHDIAELRMDAQRVANGVGREFRETFRLRRRDGSWVWCESSGSAVIDPRTGRPEVRHSVRDISQRKQAEDAHAASEAKYRQLVDLAAEGIWMHDADERVTFANRAMADMLGVSAEDLVGRRVFDFMDEEAQAVARVHLARRREGITETLENRLLHASGRPVWVKITATPILGPANAYRGTVALISDITALKAQEQATRQAEQRYRTAFEAAPVGMAQVDLDGRLLTVNQALCDMLGYPAADLEGTSLVVHSHPDDAGEAAAAIRAMATGRLRSYRAEKRYVHAGGEPVWVAVSAVSVTNEDGALTHLLVHFLDITERKGFERQLQHLADHDPLTGLLNRRGFEVELQRQAAHVARYGPAGALLVLDLDHFKQINDTLGHSAGDQFITAMADLLRRTVSEEDVVARLGGDEFAVILPYARREEAEAVAGKIVKAVREQVTVLSGARLRHVTTSVGVAMFDDLRLSGEDVLVNADLTMYDAKEAGRDQAMTYRSETLSRSRSRLGWVDRINDALDHDRFLLYAQPILDLRTNAANRYELLLRMTGEDGELIPPGAFLFVAEQVGLIARIDRWVAGRAIKLLADPDVPSDVTFEVNLSGLSLGNSDLLTDIEEQIVREAVDPSRLVFEVTETAAVTNIHAAREFADRLSAIGCRFALDDFGAGFGSFYYLKHLPFDYLKIDGEFVQSCTSTVTDRLVIEALVGIAKGLGKSTVAEFVDDPRTLRFLQEQGVDYAQGHYIGRPMPLAMILGPTKAA